MNPTRGPVVFVERSDNHDEIKYDVTTRTKSNTTEGKDDASNADGNGTEQGFTVVVITYDTTFTRDVYTGVTRFVRGASNTATLQFGPDETKRLGSVFQFEVYCEETNQ